MMFGHMGEGITGDLWRLDHKLDRKRFPTMPMAKNKLIRDYFANNIHITTSGHYSSRMLQACISEIGADRIQFAIDYPCECVDRTRRATSIMTETFDRRAQAIKWCYLDGHVPNLRV
jgi:predicted TIM-barrel fold metal-dependent hydrolase